MVLEKLSTSMKKEMCKFMQKMEESTQNSTVLQYVLCRMKRISTSLICFLQFRRDTALHGQNVGEERKGEV